MERQTILLGVSLAVLLALVGFYGAFLYEEQSRTQNETVSFPIELNITVNSENQIKTVSFDNQSMDLMAEDTDEARFYYDFDQDGSFDREIDIEHDGDMHNKTELVEIDNSTYRVYLRYQDDPSVNEDAFMTLFRVAKP